ncbi:nuclear distribution protein nudE-like 1 [Camellia sinensis]|uniref:nuclear distribution protein nudE-like 1 n=1 Tax=Camellia sinensis TaxID=4442 RepID=UPI001036EFAE|nr:nuclear distribution protein nudE-like 1 [Camellia sinensis]
MEVTTLTGGLLKKAGAAKLNADEAKAQLAKLKNEKASWKAAHVDLQAVNVELESTRRQVGDLQKELEGERAKAVEENERLQKELEAERVQVMAENESLKKELEAEKAKAAPERATLQKELDEERAKAASERAAYPDLCVVTMEQFKGSAEFQMVVDAAVASSLTRQESGRAGPSRMTAGGRTEAEELLKTEWD